MVSDKLKKFNLYLKNGIYVTEAASENGTRNGNSLQNLPLSWNSSCSYRKINVFLETTIEEIVNELNDDYDPKNLHDDS